MKNYDSIVCFSGGLDSTTVLYYVLKSGGNPVAVSFDYRQTHSVELIFASKTARRLGVPHEVVNLPLVFPENSLTSGQRNAQDELPATFVEGRNLLFFSACLSFARKLGADQIFTGVNAVDYSGYPDCRPEFIRSFNNSAKLALGRSVDSPDILIAPLIGLSKSEIVLEGLALGVDFSNTVSCYSPKQSHSCGVCDACLLRRNGFEGAGIEDPTVYV